jgi:hypothetical protein
VHDNDGLKHVSFHKLKEIHKASPKKIIYLYNDPALAIESHFRRKWAQTQIDKHGNPHKLHDLDYNDGKATYYTMCINTGRDLYGIEEQFNFMLSGYVPCPVLFIDFAQLDTKKIADFLDIPQSLLVTLHNKKRNSNKSKLPAQYQRIYNNLYQKMKRSHGTIIHPIT